ncbi:hypothetical protein PVAP13_5NG179062 [Panicum virgatum]|uniref:Uncharacterized protein n=1 Tax=Panicum virgatum TaxID=38727 RepID=A0A8T0RPJ7_PANVG|nr:hypothetical protein PVAP13_5NG179062 [Panicum virgatum]
MAPPCRQTRMHAPDTSRRDVACIFTSTKTWRQAETGGRPGPALAVHTDRIQSSSRRPQAQKKKSKITTILLYTVWNVWNKRNRRIFQRISQPPIRVLSLIKEEMVIRQQAREDWVGA